MKRMFTALVVAVFAMTGVAAAQVQFPDSPQGRLVAAFFAAVNSPDDGALVRFQDANFSPGALRRRSAEERSALNRQLRDQAGRLTPTEVRSASSSRIVVAATGSNAPGVTLTLTFAFTGNPPKLDAVEISSR